MCVCVYVCVCVMYVIGINVFSYNKQHLFYFSLAKNKENSKSCISGFDTDTDRINSKDRNEGKISPKKREDLLMKLKSLAIIEDDDDIDSDTNNGRENDNFDSDNLSCDKNVLNKKSF